MSEEIIIEAICVKEYLELHPDNNGIINKTDFRIRMDCDTRAFRHKIDPEGCSSCLDKILCELQ